MRLHCSVNGVAAHELPITDRGFQYGAGIFETIFCLSGVPLRLDAHWARLTLGCERLGIAVPDAGDPESIVVIDGGRALERSAAALAIAAGLPFPWSTLCALRIVPRPLRDWTYRIVARNRYRWFGRQDACLVPTAEIRARFLD